MRNWMNLILTESVEDKSEDNTVEECEAEEVSEDAEAEVEADAEEMTEEADADCEDEGDCETVEESAEFSFLKYLEEAMAAAPVFGKRKAPVANALEQAVDMVAQHVNWSGLSGSGEAIKDAAAKFGLNPEDVRKAITPEMVRQWHRNL